MIEKPKEWVFSDPKLKVMHQDYAAYTEDHCIDVDIDKIVWDANPVKELYNQYNSAFGSGIQLAGL